MSEVNMKSLKREEIIASAPCPACGAAVGMPCWDNRGHGDGKPRKRVHPARANVATGGKFNGPKRKKVSIRKKVALTFYESWEWKEARYSAIKRHGRRCQCCGWSPGDTREGYLVVDHIKPLALYPELALDGRNHQVLCNDCNMGKGRKHQDDFR